MNKNNSTACSYERINSNEIANVSSKSLHIEDWLAIQVIESSYLLAFQQPPLPSPHDFSDRKSFIGYWSKVRDEGTLQLIAFLRQIKEFEALGEDDRLTLIKYNLIPIGALHKCFVFNREAGAVWDLPNVDTKMYRQFTTMFDEDNSFSEAATDLCFSIIKTIEEDFTLLRLLVITLLFSKGLSMVENEPQLIDPLAAHRAESYYTRLIWNYLLDKQGEQKTIRQFTQLLRLIFRIQSTSKYLRDYLCMLFNVPSKADFLTPLMKAILHSA